MPERTTAEEDSAAHVKGRVPWIVTDVEVLPEYRLLVKFIDGTVGEVDASRMILASYAGVFERLRDPARFAEAFVSDGVVTWPGELDLAPDAMYEAIRAHGSWRIEPFPDNQG